MKFGAHAGLWMQRWTDPPSPIPSPLLVRAGISEAGFARVFGWVFTGWGLAGLVCLGVPVFCWMPAAVSNRFQRPALRSLLSAL